MTPPESEPKKTYTVPHPYTDGEVELRFGTSPYMALDSIYDYLLHVKELEGKDARAELEDAYHSANAALGDGVRHPTSEREEMLASAFFALGLRFGAATFSHPHQQSLLDGVLEHCIFIIDKHSKGGRHSYWREHEQTIVQYLERYKKRELTQEQCCVAISSDTGLELKQTTFSDWWKRYRTTGKIFS